MQQNLTSEIVALLLTEDLHTRAIAERLGSNHATVLRRLRELTADNIVDHRTEGKNKVFSIKRTLEGRNAAMIAEIQRQSLVVSRYPVLRRTVRALQSMPEISLALLFGSYAKGLATKTSDIDLFIDTLDTSLKRRLEQRHSMLSVKIGEFDPKDLLVREIIKDHVIIKGVEVYFDKTGFFEKTA